MKLALISDIHANLEALEAVFRDIDTQQVDDVICLGDVIGYGCDPLACLELVSNRCSTRLLGNHEHAALGKLDDAILNESARRSLSWTQEQMGDRAFSIIAEFTLEAVRNNLRFVHASPYRPSEWHYILTTAEADAAFRSFSERICFVGHTHLPMIYVASDDGAHRKKVGHDFEPDEEYRYIINIGSVGQPRDNDPRSCYVTYDLATGEVTYRRVEYDVQLTQQKMQQANLPTMLIERLAVGR